MASPSETLDESASSAAREIAPYLFVVLEGHDPRARGARYDLSSVQEITLGRADERRATLHDDGRLELRVPSASMSSEHARIVRDGSRWIVEDAGSRNGTFLDGAGVKSERVLDRSVIEAGRTFFMLREGPRISASSAVPDVAASDVMRERFGLRTLLPELIERRSDLLRVAKSTVPVLLLGASGTGKELLAQAVHEASGRSGRFVAVNCGALPAALVEGMLFGHTKGAFSGALRDEPGFVRAAHGGTIFLDEIADLPLSSQAALLRVLQQREVVPLGSTVPVSVDMRVVAATHRSLEDAATAGTFRGDLLARLRGFTYDVPSLDERREDLGVLVGDVLDEVAPGRVVTFTQSAARALARYAFPANVRELAQALGAAAALTTDGIIDTPHLPAALAAAAGPSFKRSAPPAALATTGADAAALSAEDEALRTALVSALGAHGGNVAAVARALDKAPYQIHRWVKRFALDLDAFRR